MTVRSRGSLILAGAGVLLLLLTACSGSASKSPGGISASDSAGRSGAASSAGGVAQPSAAVKAVAPAATRPANAPALAAEAASVPASGGTTTSNNIAADFDRKIIRNADVGLIVDNVEATSGSISSIATGLGGYISGSNLSRAGDLLRGTITLRVPAVNFDQAMTQLKALGKVRRENVSSQDVTEEYADQQARVTNLQATADQLRKVLSTITKTEEILSVYRELNQITGQIEQAKGRINYLTRLSDLATLSVELIPKDAIVAPHSDKSGWNPATTAKDALNVLAGAGAIAAQALIWLGIFVLPLGLLLGIVAALGIVARRRWVAVRRAP